jgi:uncharacterized membrane protein YkoI
MVAATALLIAMPIASAAPNASAPAREHAQTLDQVLQSAKPLTQAIGTAEQHTHGKAFYARFGMLDGKPYYQVRTSRNDQEWAGLVNADSGQLNGSGRTFTERQLSPEHKREVQALQTAHATLAEAIRNTEQRHQGAKVVEAALAVSRNGTTAYNLHFVQNGEEHVAVINLGTGRFQ